MVSPCVYREMREVSVGCRQMSENILYRANIM